MYSINFTKKALNQLEKLDTQARLRIIKTLNRCRIRPEHFLERLVGSTAYKLRVGEHRVIVDLQNKELRILVIEVGHRKNIYKKMR